MTAIPRPAIVALACTIVLVLTGSALAQRTLLDDFSSGTDANWTHEDQLLKNGVGITTYQVVNGEYRMSGTVPALPVQIGTGAWYTPSMTTPAAYSNGVIEARVRVEGVNSNIILIRGNAQLDGYIFVVTEKYDAISIERLDQGLSGKVIAGATFATDLNKTYVVKGSFIGGAFSMKIWDAVTGTEPAVPQLSGVDTTYASGWLGVGLASYDSAVCAMVGVFDDVYYTPCGSVTPYGTGCVGSNAKTPALTIDGCVSKGETFTLGIADGVPNTLALLFVGVNQAAVPVGAGCLFAISPPYVFGGLPIGASGSLTLPIPVPLTVASGTIDMQAWVIDSAAAVGAAGTVGLEVEIP